MSKLILAIIILALVSALTITVLALVLKKRNSTIRTLKSRVEFLEGISSDFQEIDNNAKEQKEQITTGSLDDRVSNSVNILSNLKKKRKST